MGLTIAIVILSSPDPAKSIEEHVKRRHVNSWDALRNVVGEEENDMSDEDQERIDLRMWSAPRKWRE